MGWLDFLKKDAKDEVTLDSQSPEEDEINKQLDQLLHDYYDVISAFKIIIPQKYINVISAKGTFDTRNAIYELFDYEKQQKDLKFQNYPIPKWYTQIFLLVKELRKIDRKKAQDIADEITAFTSQLDQKLLQFNKQYVKEVFTEVIPKIKRSNPEFKKTSFFNDRNRADLLNKIPKLDRQDNAQGYTEKREFRNANNYVYVHEDYVELFDIVMNYPLIQISFINTHTNYVRMDLFAKIRI